MIKMDSITFVISIICIRWLTVEGFPLQNNERLEPRGVGDFMSSWFWSSEKNIANVPIVDHLEGKSAVIKNDKNGKLPDNNPEYEILGQTNEGHDHNSVAEEIKPVNEIPEGAQPENVDTILEQLKENVNSTQDEEKTKTLSLWKDLTNTISKTTSPYVEVVYKNARHVVDIGAFGSSKRSRCFTDMGVPLLGLMQMLFSVLGLFGGAGNNSGLPGFPAAISSSTSNAGAISLGGLGAVPGVNFVSLQDFIRTKAGQQQPPILGGGSVVTPDTLGKIVVGGSQTQPTQPDPNTTLILAMLLKLLGNGNGSRGGSDIDLDLSKLPKGNNNTDLISIIKNLKNRSGDKDDDEDNSSSRRVIVLKTSDLDDSESGTNPFEIINIRGTPEQRFRRIRKKFKGNPDTREKIIIVNELGRLKNDPTIDSRLKNQIISLEEEIEKDDDFDEIRKKFSKFTSGGKNKLGNLGDIQFIDGIRGNKISRSSSDNDDDEELWKEFVQSLSPKFRTRKVNDPKTLKELINELNIKNFEADDQKKLNVFSSL